MLIFHCFYNRNADFGGLLEPQLQGLKIQVCNIVTALCSIYVFFFYSLEGIIARVWVAWEQERRAILEVNILIFHCFYNRKGDFGGPNIEFSLFLS